MFIGVLYVELFLPESSSLKEKRQAIRSIKDRLRSNFNVSVAEVNHQDLWQRSDIAVVCVGESRAFVEESISKVRSFMERYFPHMVINQRSDCFKIGL